MKNNDWKKSNPYALLTCEICYKLQVKKYMWKIKEKKVCKECYLNYDFYQVTEAWKDF